MKLSVIPLYLFLTCITLPVTSFAQNTLPRDGDGWTLFIPHAETQIVYVSTSGNDATGAAYTATDAAIGEDPFLPTGQVKPFKTIKAAAAAVRSGKPDWVLLKRGDVWVNEGLQKMSGLSKDAPFLYASYGTAQERPLLKTGKGGGIGYCCKSFNNVAFVDLDFYAHTRNPDDPDYISGEGSGGFKVFVGDTWTGTGMLIEGCRFRFYTGNTVQAWGTLDDVVVRRTVILDNYSTESHSQGFYIAGIGVTLEECVFDHNGWYKQQVDKGNKQVDGQATMFNHNTYFANPHNVVMRNNLFLRASSIGNKFTANDGEGSASNIVIDNNLYVEGEIAMSIGGNNEDGGYRFKNVELTNNVMLDMGRGQPTNRTLGWYIDINDWDGGLVKGNYLLHNTNPVVTNVWGFNLQGTSRNVTLDSNVVYGLTNARQLLYIENGAECDSMVLSNNTFHSESGTASLIRHGGADVLNYTFTQNHYYNTLPRNEWFTVVKETHTLDDWSVISGDEGATETEPSFFEPTRDIEGYMASLGKEATFDAFITEVRNRHKKNWHNAFATENINTWIRNGFVSEGEVPVDPVVDVADSVVVEQPVDTVVSEDSIAVIVPDTDPVVIDSSAIDSGVLDSLNSNDTLIAVDVPIVSQDSIISSFALAPIKTLGEGTFQLYDLSGRNLGLFNGESARVMFSPNRVVVVRKVFR
ncbi:MAG: hypothetical protein OCC49_09835 [Fibrobacterales bacterium]